MFDSAEHPGDVREWLPGGGGHVLITSRERGWEEIAVPVGVDVLAPAESVAILRDRVDRLTEADGQLATELGNLPLAVAQAAGFMAETGMPAAEYLDLLKTQSRADPRPGQAGVLPAIAGRRHPADRRQACPR